MTKFEGKQATTKKVEKTEKFVENCGLISKVQVGMVVKTLSG